MINVDTKATETQPQAQPLFIQGLRPHLRHAQLIALKAEDHYLRVFTDSGDDLILFRLEDAISSLETINGHHVTDLGGSPKTASRTLSRQPTALCCISGAT